MHNYESIDIDYFETTPLSFPVDVELACTPHQLFDVFEDPAAWPEWAEAISHVEWTSPKPFGVGTTRTVTLAGNQVGEEEFIAWERGKRMAFMFVRGSVPVQSFGEDYIVTDLGNGHCHLRWTMALVPTGPGKVFLRVFKPGMQWYLKRMLKSLQRYVQKQDFASAERVAAQ